MYHGSNPKALLSIKLITEGFLKELQRKSYDQINVRDLCRASDVSRQTFYNIFQSKEDVLRKCIDDIFQDIMVHWTASIRPSAQQSIHLFIQTFYENQDFMNLLIRDRLENIFSEEFVYAISGLSKMDEHAPKAHLDYHLSFYAGGLTSVLIHWMQDEDRISSDELISLLANDFKLPYFFASDQPNNNR